MGKPYLRGDSSLWWFAYVDAHGKRHLQSSKTTDEKEATKIQAAVERRVRAEKESGLAKSGPITVSKYAAQWIALRRKRKVWSADDDEARLKHALKRVGDLALTDLSRQRVRDMVRDLEIEGTLASRTVLHVYGALRVMCGDAVIEDLIPFNPCTLKLRRGELPAKRDKDPRWRGSAVFNKAEVEALISDTRLTERRRVLYAIEFLCGVRVNEVTPRVWGDYEPDFEPLGKLSFATSWNLKKKLEKGTKTGNAREVPVHPTLAKILAHWRLSGWEEAYGRQPKPSDLIVPAPTGGPEKRLSSTSELKRLHEALDLLGLRRRRQHDARRTFVSLGQADGGRTEVLEAVTHDPKGDITSLYTTWPWPTLCVEVSKLNITLREGRVVPLAATGGATAMLRSEEGVDMSNETNWRRRESNPRFPSLHDTSRNVNAQHDDGSDAGGVATTPDESQDRSNVAIDYEDRAESAGFRVIPLRPKKGGGR